MEEAGRRLVYGPLDLEDVKTIVEWKSARRMDRFKLSSPEQVEAATREAIEATKAGDVRRAVKALTKLARVKLKMASAIKDQSKTKKKKCVSGGCLRDRQAF
jgi:replication-associated recombination protein RarA